MSLERLTRQNAPIYDLEVGASVLTIVDSLRLERWCSTSADALCLVALCAAILCATATAAGSPTTTQILTHVAHRPVTAICTPTSGEMSYTNLNAAGTGPGSSARINAGDCKLVTRMIRQRFQWQASYDEQVALVAVIHEGVHLRGGPRWRDESYTQCRALHELPKVAAWLGVQLQDARENARWIWRYSHPGYHDGYCAGFTN